jgi:D-mannonate dehydratase
MSKSKPKTIKDKLNYIQANLKVKKEKVNKFGGFKYRNLEDIFEGLKPLLKETECTVTVSDEIKEVNGFNYICATVELSHNDIGHDINSVRVTGWARESVSKKGMDDSQITGSTSSYARKYAMNGLFAIDDTADADSMDNRDTSLYNVPDKGSNLTKSQINNLLDAAGKIDEKTHGMIAEKIDSRHIHADNYEVSMERLQEMKNE